MGVTSGAGTAYPLRAPEFTPGFQWVSCYLIFIFYMYVLLIIVCPFVLFFLAIVLSVLRYTDSDFPFGTFKLFLHLFHSLSSRNFLICQRQYPDKNAFTCTGKNLIFKHTIYVAATMMHFTFWLELYMCLFIVSIAQYLHCVLVPRQALARYHSDRQWNLWPYSYQFLHWQHTSTGLKEQKYIIFKELRELSLKMNKNLLQRQNLKSYIWKTLCVKFCQN